MSEWREEDDDGSVVGVVAVEEDEMRGR